MSQIGLTQKEAAEKLKKFGKNILVRTKKISPWKILLAQFTSPLVVILMIAALFSVGIGFLPGQHVEYIDAILILIIVFISGISGFIQEYKAEKSIEALRDISTPSIQVIRDGEVSELSVVDLVPGDVVILEAGDVVPADCKIIEMFSLKVDESILTGESVAVNKIMGDEVFMNTSVNVGSAKIEVLKTGMNTRVGHIAKELEKIEEGKTLFEEELEVFGKKIFKLTILVAGIVFLGGLLKYDLYTSALTAISLAVAAIPEGLPAVVALSLAIGAKSLFKNNALIRKLSVVESIGAIDIICTDKTGTITKNEMTATHFFLDDKVLEISHDDIDDEIKKELTFMLSCGALCSDVKVKGHPEGKRQYLGEQTEIGLVKIAEKIGIFLDNLSDRFQRVNEVPFSSERKMMSVVVNDKQLEKTEFMVCTKGAPEVVLEKCNKVLINGKVVELSKDEKKKIIDQYKNFSSNALRVLGFAYKITGDIENHIEDNLIWIGLQAMIDPPHPEIVGVLKDCKGAGIRVIMITGDNAITAKAIADQIGLKTEGTMEGHDLDKLKPGELKKILDEGCNIFARTTPFHKMQILKVLQKRFRVAMTGDGVNDSLALKQADVGAAMGINGTTVAKEASDIVLLDDNFSTIVVAIREGRRIFNNIKKFIYYLLVTNLSEVLVLFISTLFLTLEKPILLPAQILWINLLTDGLPALALGVDPAQKDIMTKKPRKNGESILNKELGTMIVVIGIAKTVFLLGLFLIILPRGEEIARTTLFTGFVLFEFITIATIRFREKIGWFSNPWLLFAILFSLVMQLIVIYSPIRSVFHLEVIGLYEWVVMLIGVVVGFAVSLSLMAVITKKFSVGDK